MTQPITRRTFISASAVAPMAIAVASNAPAHPVEANPGKGAWVRWLDGGASAVAQGVTWGTPWPHGAQKGGAYNFGLRDADQKIHVLQSWPLAYWPDGSLKFTAHALPPNYHVGNGPFEVVVPRSAPKDIAALTVLLSPLIVAMAPARSVALARFILAENCWAAWTLNPAAARAISFCAWGLAFGYGFVVVVQKLTWTTL